MLLAARAKLTEAIMLMMLERSVGKREGMLRKRRRVLSSKWKAKHKKGMTGGQAYLRKGQTMVIVVRKG